MASLSRKRPLGSFLGIIGPGLLVAATGVGAGDLATAGFAGSRLGVAVLWAVAAGAFLKFVLNEGLARWQLATGETLLEGAFGRLGPAVTVVFLIYLLPWSFFVGAALISACGVTAHSILPMIKDPAHAKLIFGGAHSVIGVAIAWFGGFRVFERIMAVCIGVMFVAVVMTAILLGPDWAAAAKGLVVPRIPQASEGGLTWTIALMGGVGGTLTVLCYGYWMREQGRRGPDELRVCRIDLAVAYAATALFGMSMLTIASGRTLDGSGTGLIVTLANELEVALGPWGKWVFLIGAWAAVFTSLLGVWQAVPYIFADTWNMIRRKPPGPVDTRCRPYRLYLLAIAFVPLLGVSHPWREVQKYYAVFGAAFLPMLAAVLLYLNGKAIGERFRNRAVTIAVLLITLAFFLIAGFFHIRTKWS